MLVSAVTSFMTGKGANGHGVKNGHAQSKPIAYDRNNYFGSTSKETNTQLIKEDMFHKIALWKDFCEKQIINDESQKESFNYLA